MTVRRTRNARDFFIAGQGVGLVVTSLATTADSFMNIASAALVGMISTTTSRRSWSFSDRDRAAPPVGVSTVVPALSRSSA